jgi:type II secretory pathway component PulK
MPSRTRSSTDGYITIAVLVFIGILAAVVSSTLAASRPTLGLMHLGAQELAAEGLLDGGLAFAAYSLFTARQTARALDGTELRIGEGSITVRVGSEASRVDINAADADVLAGLYAAAGGRSMTPDVFAARVIDWRDSDDDQTPGGAERGLYAVSGAVIAPANGRFRSTADLRFVLGVRADDLNRLEPFTTVFNPKGGIDPMDASETVLAALPDLSAADRGLLLQARRAAGIDRGTLLGMLRSPSRYLLEEPYGLYRVRVTARLSNGFTRSAEGVIAHAPKTARSYGIVHWAALRGGERGP